ncbi:MAG: 8-amino-7-oxononanoate synthase [Ignavibacteria bacterium GWA2_55_11]|nr:MAG: 8-amino-7-oxononanoate synthase [Ignavibacteria bacterium GWA2_55_11]OGU44635.1 MAG: 8-amino-7-oxononanoate synthase [Ignavibacteria bacterium GWC2_56_12]OGU62900.1 MAG: 8-amino-7-oxononanoate synthase [Ignavibacteria bacterium RIFCSPHIGHO2_02_FULL_56_12]OGU76143.1 MAG: 8-amino-7-oxononanoate synthase [Ignavibacteria bacterium RIFCSPLOWO2_12_FULL_56_21]HAV22538.1 8-amino-7-oxononanoate synthase [Bacteroidota bacterium]
MDLFEKCRSFTRADETKAAGLYPYFHAIEENEGPVVTIEGRKVIMAGSNNYLGLTAHPDVKEAAIKAVEKYGTGCSGSRYLTGTLDLHVELEARLSKFFGKEDCLLFSTGYQTAQGVIPSLVQRGEYVVTDKDNHACIVAGNLIAAGAASYAGAKPNEAVVRYKHNDMKHLEAMISRLPLEAGKIIVSDGVFSTSGEIVDLPNMVRVARKYNARILIDDAHSVGVIGKGGRGTASHYGLENETDMTMGTFSKTFASLGGFVVGDRAVINYLKHTAPALIFSASPTPASVASAIAALGILEREPERIDRLMKNARKMRSGLKQMGYRVNEHDSAVVPVIIGDTEKVLIMWKYLFEGGVFVNAFIRPGVPPGMEMLRTSYMATHEDEHLDKILDVFATVGRKVGVLS